MFYMIFTFQPRGQSPPLRKYFGTLIHGHGHGPDYGCGLGHVDLGWDMVRCSSENPKWSPWLSHHILIISVMEKHRTVISSSFCDPSRDGPSIGPSFVDGSDVQKTPWWEGDGRSELPVALLKSTKTSRSMLIQNDNKYIYSTYTVSTHPSSHSLLTKWLTALFGFSSVAISGMRPKTIQTLQQRAAGRLPFLPLKR